jgi:RNA polymerase sigma-70 factor (ECF subfamily)
VPSAPILPLTPRPAPPGTVARPPVPIRPAAGRGGASGPDRGQQDLWTARLRQGDSQALREVVEAYSERITSVVSGMLRDRDAVDDVVQETFVKAFYRIGSFHGDAGLYTWLYRVAVNAAKDHVKRRGRRPAAALDDLPPGTGIPSRDEPALERLEDRETRLRVRAAIQSLPAKFRAVLVLREIEGLRYEEIAEVLDVSQGTVESRLFRARRRLRARLARWDPSA